MKIELLGTRAIDETLPVGVYMDKDETTLWIQCIKGLIPAPASMTHGWWKDPANNSSEVYERVIAIMAHEPVAKEAMK